MNRGFKKAIEALLFVHHQPIAVKDFLNILGEAADGALGETSGGSGGAENDGGGKAVSREDIEECLEELSREYSLADKPYSLENIAGGWQILTRPQYEKMIAKLSEIKKYESLTRPQLETLAVIAYSQPVTRGEIEDIRGVGCSPVIKVLLERGFIQSAGKAERLGAPTLYATSKRFLEVFGMKDIKDLPERADITKDFRNKLKSRQDGGETEAPAE